MKYKEIVSFLDDNTCITSIKECSHKIINNHSLEDLELIEKIDYCNKCGMDVYIHQNEVGTGIYCVDCDEWTSFIENSYTMIQKYSFENIINGEFRLYITNFLHIVCCGKGEIYVFNKKEWWKPASTDAYNFEDFYMFENIKDLINKKTTE